MRSSIVIAIMLAAQPVSAEFLGRLEFKPTGCQQAGLCELVYDFAYRSPDGTGWQANAGLKTDGASIPAWAQRIIGGPWEADFIRAAVIHDWYCIRTVRTRAETHRMFYDALIESGVGQIKALTMYYAVLVGSHMWIDLMEGRPCNPKVGNCIQNTGGGQIPDATIRKNAAGVLQAYRAPRFERPEIAKDISAATIIAGGSVMTPNAIEEMAKTRHPKDLFLHNGSSIEYEGASTKYPDR